ncbi:SIS domain-containing protein [Arsenicitalea aurantiaca]|uniref:SIS domain-containing protein n=1 Tax=Arsenicitalea aurantiaca TaxID=1783274 RepID=A0A433XL93_9HYPH|nr:SIS domain-containing protein [Arsenicitalea aurantiaca]RUT34794.1 SIS domain-containing protein [Arsenicitalea aurantiaca]
MLSDLDQQRPRFGPAELRLADYILQAPRAATQLSLATLSANAKVSEPTVIRLCRKLGCTGFPDFKLRLAEDLAAGTPYVHHEVNPYDPMPEISRKVLDSTISALVTLSKSLDAALLERAVTVLAQAHRVDLFGTGPSSVVAYGAQQKFMFLEMPAVFQHDSHLQIMSATGLGSRDVAMCFSFTGQTTDIVKCATQARKAGATVIGVTRNGSALAEASHITIAVDTVENTFVYSPTTTRLAHFAVVDILSTALAVRRGPGISDRMQAMKEALLDKRIPQ